MREDRIKLRFIPWTQMLCISHIKLHTVNKKVSNYTPQLTSHQIILSLRFILSFRTLRPL